MSSRSTILELLRRFNNEKAMYQTSLLTSAVAAFAAMGITLFMLIFSSSDVHSPSLEDRVAIIALRQRELRRDLTQGLFATTASVTEPATSADLRRLETDIANLKTLLLDDPEATVTIPLMKKDIATLTHQQGELLSRIRETATFSKWFIGIMLTMSIGVLGLAVGVFVKK